MLSNCFNIICYGMGVRERASERENKQKHNCCLCSDSVVLVIIEIIFAGLRYYIVYIMIETAWSIVVKAPRSPQTLVRFPC